MLLSFPWLRIALAAGALALAGSAGWGARAVLADRDLAQLQGQRDADRASWSTASAEASEAARETERLRRRALEKAATDADAQNTRLLADAAAAAAAGRRLHDTAAAFAAGACPSPGSSTPAEASPATPTPAVVLAELFRRADERAGDLAAAADAARAAGAACEASFDALTETRTQ